MSAAEMREAAARALSAYQFEGCEDHWEDQLGMASAVLSALPLPVEEGRVEMREALEQAYTEGFRDGAYDSKDLPRSWKNSDTARFAASIPDEEGMVERVARAIAWEACGDLPTADDRKIARAAIRAINGGKP